MNTIRIFIASSSELKEDRDQFRMFLSQENDRLHTKGIYLELIQWENFLDTVSQTRLQDEYNKELKNAQIVICLFFTKAGKYTQEEFDTALQQFKETGSPLIYTYFKSGAPDPDPNDQLALDLAIFKKRLSNIGHFYTVYNNIDDLKFQFRKQLDILKDKGIVALQEEIKKETVDAIKNYFNIKNALIGSTISAGGDVQIGDRSIHTESLTSKWLHLFLFLLVPILAVGGAYLWYQNNVMKRPLNLKVLIENQTPNAMLSEPNGSLILTYGGKPDLKKAISTEAIFENIPYNFKSDTLRLQYEARGFRLIDTSFVYMESIKIPVWRNNDLRIIQGYIFEEGTEPLEGIEGVKVSIPCCSVLTDASGRFSLEIPFEHQRKKQRLEIFKEGFHQKSITEPVIKGIEIQTYLAKKNRSYTS